MNTTGQFIAKLLFAIGIIIILVSIVIEAFTTDKYVKSGIFFGGIFILTGIYWWFNVTKKICPNCGYRIPITARVCIKCDYILTDKREPIESLEKQKRKDYRNAVVFALIFVIYYFLFH